MLCEDVEMSGGKDVYICFPAIYFLLIATNISYHLSFIREPILDNKPAQP
jgi:hypothetical protein